MMRRKALRIGNVVEIKSQTRVENPCHEWHPMNLLRVISWFLLCVVSAQARAATYAEVHAIFAKHCLACHDSNEAEGGLVLETREMILAGGDSGDALVPGNAAESLLVKLVERQEKPFMPPPKKAAKLSDGDIKTIRAWIDAGAPG